MSRRTGEQISRRADQECCHRAARRCRRETRRGGGKRTPRSVSRRRRAVYLPRPRAEAATATATAKWRQMGVRSVHEALGIYTHDVRAPTAGRPLGGRVGGLGGGWVGGVGSVFWRCPPLAGEEGCGLGYLRCDAGAVIRSGEAPRGRAERTQVGPSRSEYDFWASEVPPPI